MGGWIGSCFALGAYALISLLFFGLPVLSRPTRVVVGSENDPKVFIWMLAWWPHAIVHGENPIVSHAIWAPSGFDLVWATSIPGLALALSPLTALAGPVVSFNVAAILLPALAAWTAFLLCRAVTRSLPASLLGGYLFGFSSYMLGHEQGHMNLTAVFLLPLVALVLLRFLRGELSRRGLAVRLGLLLAAQISLSLEVFATLSLALAVALALAFAVDRPLRRPLRALAAPVAAAYAIGCALTSPLLYYAVTDFVRGQLGPTGIFVADALNLIVPTRTVALGSAASRAISARFPGIEIEQTAYFGIPLLLLLALLLLERRREPSTRFLFLAFAAAIVGAFGKGLHVNGHRLFALPWSLVARLPVFDNIYPERLTVYATLAAAVGAALWVATTRSPWLLRLGLPLLVVASLAPDLETSLWHEKLDVPAFIADGAYERCLPAGANVLVLPYDYLGSSVLWQALAGFHFRMPGGQVGDQTPPAFGFDDIFQGIFYDNLPVSEGPGVEEFLQAHDVNAILVDPTDPWPWRRVLASYGPPEQVGGLLLYPVGGPGPPAGCGRP